MPDNHLSPRHLYLLWVEDQVEEYKASLRRDELLALADRAVAELFDDAGGQYPLTEILLRDAVDELIFRELGLPTYHQWLRSCRFDTRGRPVPGTPPDAPPGG